jgi:hypothetical protein
LHGQDPPQPVPRPGQEGRPKDWSLPVRDVLIYHGVGLIVPVAGDIKLMPGTASDPAYRKIDVDVDTGRCAASLTPRPRKGGQKKGERGTGGGRTGRNIVHVP